MNCLFVGGEDGVECSDGVSEPSVWCESSEFCAISVNVNDFVECFKDSKCSGGEWSVSKQSKKKADLC